jgi:hypothetical protein
MPLLSSTTRAGYTYQVDDSISDPIDIRVFQIRETRGRRSTGLPREHLAKADEARSGDGDSIGQ